MVSCMCVGEREDGVCVARVCWVGGETAAAGVTATSGVLYSILFPTETQGDWRLALPNSPHTTPSSHDTLSEPHPRERTTEEKERERVCVCV